jgi:hypothetical protein
MTDCPNGDIRDLLPDLLHGRLGAAKRAEVEAHVRDCADCRDELELLRDMRVALRPAPAVDVGAIVTSIPPYRAPARQVSSRSWGGWRIAAAITLLAAGGTSVAVARHGTTVRTDSAQVATMREFDSLPGNAHVAVTVEPPVVGSSSTPETATPNAARELAFAGGTIGDLDDSELSTLIDDVGSLRAVTPPEPDNAAMVSPIAPTSPSGMNN